MLCNYKRAMYSNSSRFVEQCTAKGSKGLQCTRRTGVYGPYCWQHTRNVLGIVHVMDQVNWRGNVPIAYRSFAPHECIVKVSGPAIISRERKVLLYGTGLVEHMLRHPRGNWYCDFGPSNSCALRNAPDVGGSNKDTNCAYLWDVDNNVVIIATREILRNEAFVLDYDSVCMQWHNAHLENPDDAADKWRPRVPSREHFAVQRLVKKGVRSLENVMRELTKDVVPATNDTLGTDLNWRPDWYTKETNRHADAWPENEVSAAALANVGLPDNVEKVRYEVGVNNGLWRWGFYESTNLPFDENQPYEKTHANLRNYDGRLGEVMYMRGYYGCIPEYDNINKDAEIAEKAANAVGPHEEPSGGAGVVDGQAAAAGPMQGLDALEHEVDLLDFIDIGNLG
jgi:hypothetical protein